MLFNGLVNTYLFYYEGARFTMSKTQETKWVRPDVGSELASIMPETSNAAETRTISTQGNNNTSFL